jgi:hypothetical protein
MNIQKQLEFEHSKANTLRVAHYIGNDANKFEILLACLHGADLCLSQRAAWVMSYCFEHEPKLLIPYLNVLINKLEAPKLHVAVKRNTMRILQFIEIPEMLKAQLFDRCLIYLMDKSESVAVKAFSMKVAANICQQHPELKQEVIPLIKDLMEHSDRPGIISRGRKVLKSLRRL